MSQRMDNDSDLNALVASAIGARTVETTIKKAQSHLGRLSRGPSGEVTIISDGRSHEACAVLIGVEDFVAMAKKLKDSGKTQITDVLSGFAPLARRPDGLLTQAVGARPGSGFSAMPSLTRKDASRKDQTGQKSTMRSPLSIARVLKDEGESSAGG